jgi:DNA-binding MarR family transcriptional regulator
MPADERPRSEAHADPADFVLTTFFPYRLAVLAERVSQAVAGVYADRFDLTRAEWRVLAALAANGEMAARDVGPYSTLDKMQVSRAVARMEERAIIERHEDASDRRAKILRLTETGAALFHELLPRVVEREAYILGSLDERERAALGSILEKIFTRADELARERESGKEGD